uniref:Dynein heavy chain C-terminal domain-containing protein n=1 Tax=Chromera velia CCMP2878 TaxID=1169474 RepID=A0A0G4I0P8_9ALVE|eukprot:Cvel_10003.t1-p1 / transcript=Cvel_10003.t1 / gene=Cvel_10003 / organism=Chromera_velia_CCMP2878 / gene_product=Dynein heavy chain 6, axonemal, putative / transcript_product=Dynein heavy chain 6, axonemal, putative / location=Cvel_scaffold593:2623-6276(-) / protein_length=625 / sequence_SO=supercontig / SO=protein_coding / is_pseudo=false
MGKEFVEVPLARMAEIYEDSSPITPVVFVLSTGADPTAMLFKFAAEHGVTGDKLKQISLGQGQGPVAKRFIFEGTKDGRWILLQNCHLAKSFMPELEKIVENFAEDLSIDPNFRLFLTSMPAPYFPVPVLQNSVKFTTEPPKGIKANLKRSLMDLTDEVLDSCEKPEAHRKIRFGLMFFHGIVQERRKFGPLGWNVKYEFNDSDMETSTTVLKNMLDAQKHIPWDTLQFVIGQINYGGRVTDDWDRRTLMNILSIYCNPEVLNEEYVFSESGTYRVPPSTDIVGMRSYVDSLPIADLPEIFGMHENANINFQKQESDTMVDTVLSIQPRETGGGEGKSSDEIVLEVSEKLVASLPEMLSTDHSHPTAFAMDERTGIMESLGTCLTQEMQRFNKLLAKMSASLALLGKAVRGLVVMSEELDVMYTAFNNNQVPSTWSKVAYPSLKPLSSWFDDLIARVSFLRSWISDGRPKAYWISALFFPQGFLTSVLQMYSRREMIPIDTLAFEHVVLAKKHESELESAPKDGCYIYGMFMDGARWDFEKNVIADQLPGVMYDSAPIIHLNPAKNLKKDPTKYEIPLYKTSVRAGTLSTTGHSTNFVIAIEVPTEHPPSYWVLKGAAMLTMLDD